MAATKNKFGQSGRNGLYLDKSYQEATAHGNLASATLPPKIKLTVRVVMDTVLQVTDTG